MNVFDEFEWRGMVYDATEGLCQVFAENKISAYIGFDPSAPSLHVGTLLPIMGLVHLQRFGHTPIAIAGGGTGRIGDPSGKAEERPLMTEEEVDANLAGIKEQLSHYLDFNTKTNPAIMVNNADWTKDVTYLDLLRDVGKYFSVNYMLNKESVRRRIEDRSHGISYTEFSYMLLQANDFLELYDRYNCRLQVGGNDQWGNITAGIDLIQQFSFGVHDPFNRSHSLQVCGRDIGDDADVRPADVGQGCNFAGSVHTEFNHRPAMIRAQLQ